MGMPRWYCLVGPENVMPMDNIHLASEAGGYQKTSYHNLDATILPVGMTITIQSVDSGFEFSRVFLGPCGVACVARLL